MSKIELQTISSSKDPALDELYELYLKCFPIKEERVPKEDFEAILASNHGDEFEKRKQRVGTDSKYFISYIRDNDTGKIIGGAAYDVFKGCCDKEYGGTTHASFIFVDEEHRSKGYEKVLAEEIQKKSKKFCGGEKPVLCFAELNAVGRMTVDQYKQDKNVAGNPAVRRVFAELKGLKTLHFPYTQPPLVPLADGGDVCDCLDLAVLGNDSHKSLKSDVVQEHLERFFKDLFPEEASLDMKQLEKMKNFLQNNAEIPFIEVGKTYGKISRAIDDFAKNNGDKGSKK